MRAAERAAAAHTVRRRSRLRVGGCAGRRADARARHRRHRRAGARGPDADHHATASSPRSAAPRSTDVPAGRARRSTSTGKSVIPGLVMVHEHLYYPTGPGVYGQLGESFSRLYLAGGVTTMRTGGNMNGFMDLNMKRLIEARPEARARDRRDRAVPERPEHVHPDAHAARTPRTRAGRCSYWADEGATSLKAYMQITRGELARGDRRSARARHQGHRPSLLGHLRGSRRPRHRQSRARLLRRDRFRRRQEARRVSRARASASRRSPRSTRTARRSRRWSRR